MAKVYGWHDPGMVDFRPQATSNPLQLPVPNRLLFELGVEAASSQRFTHPGQVTVRRAARAVVWRGAQLLLVHSERGGDYKFPGGGVAPGEELSDALVREIAEECAMVAVAGAPVGTVIEYRPDLYTGGLFAMASHYLSATVTGAIPEGQRLDDYEAARGFRPEWITPARAAAANRVVLGGRHDHWVPRETQMLELLATDRTLGRPPRG
jgi:8-oxo-dGTP pyrophosphatase MutT (NUDIX family)